MELRDVDRSIGIVRGLSPAEKLAIAQGLWETARSLAEAGVRARQADLTDEQVATRVRDMFQHAST